FIISDIRMIQRLNDWADSLAGGLEVFVNFNHFKKNDLLWEETMAIANEDWPVPLKIQEMASGLMNYDHHEATVNKSMELIGEAMDYYLYIEKVSDRYGQVFEWLNLLSRQVNILLGIILVVVSVNIISIVLILVMERTQMIGMFKALGAGDGLIRKIFIYNGINLIAKGLLFGNVLGLGLCFLQDQFKIVTLNPHDYYMSFVPISWDWDIVIILNICTFLVVSLVLLLSTMVIARIHPINAIRFD